MAEKVDALKVWTEAFNRISRVENDLLEMLTYLEPFDRPNFIHLTKIAAGNMRTVRQTLIVEQADLMKHVRSRAKKGKGV